jgi:peptidyl-prolyl cis-trans isomerase D
MPVTGDTYATVYPHWYSRFTFTGEKIPMTRVQEVAQQQLQRQRLPDFALMYMVQRVGRAAHPAKGPARQSQQPRHPANDEDVRNFLHTGQYGELLFPKGKFIGEDKYRQFISSSST